MNKKFIWFLVIFFLLYYMTSNIAGFYTDYEWFRSQNGLDIFWVLFLTRINVQMIFAGIFIGMFFLNFLLIRILGGKGRIFTRNILDRIQLPYLGSPRRVLMIILAILVIGTGLIMGNAAAAYWKEYLLFKNALPFSGHMADPLFNHDPGFYIFSLPFYRFLYLWFIAALAIITAFSVLFHVINRGIIFERKIEFSLFARAHISTLLALIVILVGTGYRLAAYELLFSHTGKFYGPGYTAVHARLLAYNAAMIISFIAASLLLFNIVRKSFKLPLLVLATLLPSYFLLGTVYPALQQRFFVEPKEQEMERPYIINNMTFTRKAYAIDVVKETPFVNSRNLTMADIKKNRDTLENVRLWDWRPLKQTYKQMQELKSYYYFNDIDVDRYVIGNRRVAVNLAARELSADSLGKLAKTWQNRHLIYTHGYGAVMSRVDRVTSDGQPEFLIKDIPPVTATKIRIDVPQIYYGEHANSYCITGTSIDPGEFDYPSGDDNRYTTYTGTGGVVLNTFLKKLIFAAANHDINILISGNITSKSRILYKRNILDMARTLTPFLMIDDDPYLVISKGRLVWMIDAYTVSDRYPYSTPVEFGDDRINYIRNSVKITVDAYNGDMHYYLADPADPIAGLYGKIFPGLFSGLNSMPEDLREHVRYPGTLFDIQAAMLRTFHMKDPNVLYNNEDAWEIARQVYDKSESLMSSYYLITSLPGKKQSDFNLILPFTPLKKNNMIAFMSAGCDAERYGELNLYLLPKDKLSYGPLQIEARINQDPELSKLLTLWGQKGSSVIRGNMMAIPVEESLLFIEPLYLKSETSEMPELKLVIAAAGDHLCGDSTLDGALEKLFEKMPFSADIVSEIGKDEIRALSEKAYRHFLNAENHMREGNWAAYGDELRRLKETLIQMKQQ